jgi:hypothetical protein
MIFPDPGHAMITETVTQPNDLFATANSCLLAPHEIDTAGLQQVFGQMLAHHVDYADLYFQYSRAEGWALEEPLVTWRPESDHDLAKRHDERRCWQAGGSHLVTSFRSGQNAIAVAPRALRDRRSIRASFAG